MKFLIDNYAEYNNSQAIYFQKHLKDEEHECFFINEPKMSMFDYFDTIKPDIYITSTKKLSKDAVVYLSENQNIRLLLSVMEAKNSEILEIEEILRSHKIDCPFFITNRGDADMPFTKKIKMTRIMHGVDVNMPSDKSIEYKISKAVVTNNNYAVRNYDSTYHVVSTNQSIAKDVDICLPINVIKTLINNYDEIIFSDIDSHLPQLFFEAISLGKRVYYDIKGDDESLKAEKIINGIFGIGDGLNYKSTNRIEDFSDLQAVVNEKHTSIKRTKTLLSQIPSKK